MSFIKVEEDILKELVIQNCNTCIHYSTHINCNTCKFNKVREMFEKSLTALKEMHRLRQNVKYRRKHLSEDVVKEEEVAQALEKKLRALEKEGREIEDISLEDVLHLIFLDERIDEYSDNS